MDLDLMRLDRRLQTLLGAHDGPCPGATIGVVRAGRLVAHRSAGLASVELGVPIGARTRFRIASVSKQFTCAAVLLLAHEGRLSIEDAAGRYLPEIPLDPRVTVAQLMHNSSGVRDMLELMRMGGADLGTPIRQADLVAAIGRQERLNFEPGTRFLYSNSNFLLLGLIVEAVTGRGLAEVLQARVLGPAGMSETRMTPDPYEAIPHLATGYFPQPGGGWRRAPHAFPLHGEGGLVSTVEDLALWDRALETGLVAPWLAEALATQHAFPGGVANSYARGQAVRPHRGQRTVSHGGLWPGYRSEFLRLPELGVTVIALANSGAIDPNLMAHLVADAVLDGDRRVPGAPGLPERAVLEGMAGRWIEEGGLASMDIVAGDAPAIVLNGLKAMAAGDEAGRLIVPRANSGFAVRRVDADAMEVTQDAGHVSRWRRAPAAAVPAGLAGTWRSGELDAVWTIADGRVRVRGPVASTDAWEVEAVDGDQVRIHVPGTLYRAWLDARVAGDELVASGGRVKEMRLVRVGG